MPTGQSNASPRLAEPLISSAEALPAPALAERVVAALEHRRREVQAEIHGYPSPIPRCDAQFNHLLEERSQILSEQARLAELLRGSPTRAAIDEFVRASAVIQADAFGESRAAQSPD